jgi:pimeloyl-ACP methyl ester carboxylesterase
MSLTGLHAAVWRSCPEVATEVIGSPMPGTTYDCATITVPQNWAAPDRGKTFDLALVRVRSQQRKDRIGSLVINPGGPGGSGVDAAVGLTVPVFGLPQAILERFDVVGFDPRGVARSSPVRCVSDADLELGLGVDPEPDSEREWRHLIASSKKMADNCRARYGDQLALFSTRQAAHDLDAVRRAVGDKKLTYLGYSYGTLLGATYAQLFPTNVRAMVLDGAVNPRQGVVAATETQARGFERAFYNFSGWCKKNPKRCTISKNPRAAVKAALAKAEKTPVLSQEGRAVTPGWLTLATQSAMYSDFLWPELSNAIDSLAKNNPDPALKLADEFVSRSPDGSYANMVQANAVVNCADQREAVSVAQVRKLETSWRKRYPLFGASIATGLMTCAVWHGKRDPYPVGPARQAPPIVVVGKTGDPATPHENTAQLAKMLGTGRVVTVEGEGHGSYPGYLSGPAGECLDAAIEKYLVSLQAPPNELRCRKR